MVLNFNNLTNQLNKLNIKENFIIVHSDLHKHQFFAKNLDIFWQTLLKCLGKNKTYIIPTFTTNFVKFKFWDYYKSKSQTGIFSEYFRKNIADIRSIHPIHSVAIWGKKKMMSLNINQNLVLEKVLFGNGYVSQKMFAICP